MLPGKVITPNDVLRMLRRRRWLLILPFAVGLATAPAIARLVPKLYRSETLIMVVPQRVPDSYVKSTVTATVEDRLPSISDHILSRSRLERIILDFDLYRDERTSGVMEDLVLRMRRDISVPPPGQTSNDSFRVSFVSTDPEIAQKVTSRLASLYIEENARDRGTLAESTSQFLESQLEQAKQRLIEHEQKLESYRRRYAGELPSQLESNLQAIQTTQLQMQSSAESANRARERRLLIERQLVDAEMSPLAAAVTGEAAQAAVPSAAQQLQAAEERLEQLRQRFTNDHPDIRSQERTIRELRARASDEAAALKAGAAAPPRAPSAAEIARQKRIRDLQAELEVIDRQLATSEQEQQELRARMASLQSKIDVVPTRESELVELTRDYSTLQAQYQSLLAKREESKLAADLERRQIGEQFRIIDPASLPAKPFNQAQRIAFMFAGSVVGLLLGLVTAGFLEYRDNSFSTESDVARVLNVAVLAMVPDMPSERERRSRRRRRLAIDCAALTVLVACAAILAIWRLQI